MQSRASTRTAVLIGLLLAVAGCSAPQHGGFVHDPFEESNRQTHAFNKALDEAVFRPLSRGGNAVPKEVTGAVVDFAENTALPGMVVNGVLQGDLESAGINTVRFLINTTVGIGGLIDVADRMKLYERETDFGATMARWGVPEGAYVELPVYGPSTQRDTFGLVVDVVFDPLQLFVPDVIEPYIAPSRIAGEVITRGRFSTSVDTVLYESADSYAITRQMYLQNRRFELGRNAPVVPSTQVNVADPYADPYADHYADPYADLTGEQ